MKPFWERVLRVGDRPIVLTVEMGLSSYELVMCSSDTRDTVRVVLAKPSWDFDAQQLKKAIDDGLHALNAAAKR